MSCFQALNFTGKEFLPLNCFRIHLQVLFLSDAMDTSEKSIKQQYMRLRAQGETWSTLVYQQERPPARDVKLQQSALLAIVHRGWLQDRLGRFINKGHKIWPWQYDKENSPLYHLKGSIMNVYTPSEVPRFTHHSNCWTWSYRSAKQQSGSNQFREGDLARHRHVQHHLPSRWTNNSSPANNILGGATKMAKYLDVGKPCMDG
jgi:hypothetical protein